MSPSVFAIMINYKTPEMTIDCVSSILKSDYDNCHIIVVDNCSGDDSVSILKEKLPEDVVLIESKSNDGFSAGNNIGMNYAFEHGADYVMLINNDTVIDSKMITGLFENCDKNSVTAPKIYYFNEPDKIWYGGGKINYRLGRITHNHENETDDCAETDVIPTGFITGCCMFIPKDVYKKVGPMCEDYFMYVEDADYCLSMINCGVKLKYVPTAKMWHKVGASTGNKSKFTLYYANRGRLMLMDKFNFPFSAKAFQLITRIILCIGGYLKNSNEKIILKAIKDYKHDVKGKIDFKF